MKTKVIFLMILFFAVFISCDDDNKVNDPIFEFVSFKGNTSVNLNEFNNSTEAYPLVVQLWAFKPYSEDIDLTLEVTGTNVQEGVDFTVTPNPNLKIKAGSLTSDTVWIKTIDNAAGANEEKSFEVTLKTASKPDVKIGFGLTEPENTSVNFTILDDECPLTTDIYTNPDLINYLDWGYDEDIWDEEDVELSATGVLAGNQLTIHGDLIYYESKYPAGSSLVLTLTPDGPGATRGKATFGEKLLGTATDDTDYKLVEVGEGRYDVCSGTVSVEFDLLWLDGVTWKHYYFVRSVFSL